MINIFIDANKYLSLFGLNDNELEAIRTIKKYIDDNKIILWLPEQVKNEVNKNIESEMLVPKFNKKFNKIKKFLDNKNNNRELDNLPECKGELEEINKILKEETNKINQIIEKIKNKLIEKINKEADLPYKIVHELFSVARFIPHTNEIISEATIRKKLNNPPGKGGSYGDSVIWESLLQKFPEKEDIYFIGFDKDFASKLNNKLFSSFLINEWEKKKKSKIIYFKHIGDFTKKMIPEIQLSDEIIEKEKEIEQNESIKSDIYNPFTNIAILNEIMRKDIAEMNEKIRRLTEPSRAIKKMMEGVIKPINSIRQQCINLTSIYTPPSFLFPYFNSNRDNKKDNSN